MLLLLLLLLLARTAVSLRIAHVRVAALRVL